MREGPPDCFNPRSFSTSGALIDIACWKTGCRCRNRHSETRPDASQRGDLSLVLVTCPSTLSEEKKKNHADRTGLADNQVQGHGLAGRPGEAGGISRGTFESLLFFTWDTVKEREGARARGIDERADAPMVVASKSERERERERRRNCDPHRYRLVPPRLCSQGALIPMLAVHRSISHIALCRFRKR